MTTSDILDGAFKLMKANARTIGTIVAVFVVPVQLLVAFAQRNILGGSGLLDAIGDPSVTDTATGRSSGDLAITVGATVVNIVLLPFLAGAISKVVAASYLGVEMTARPALRATLRRFWALLWSWVLVHLLEVSGFLVGLILVIAAAASGGGVAAALSGVAVMGLGGIAVLLVVMALSVAVAPAVVVEELGAMGGIRRSWGLMRRRLFAVLGVALLAGFIASVLGQVLAVVPTTLAVVIGLRWGWLLLAAGSIIVALVTTPIVAIVATLQYFDARIRFEGFDLEVMAAEMARGEHGH